MSASVRADVRPPAPARVALARFTARHPEWWVVAVVVAAWMVLVGWGTGGPVVEVGRAGAGHAHHGGAGTGAGATSSTMLPAEATTWLLMVVAMMGAVTVPRIRHVAQCCLGRARVRAIAQTSAGVLLAWSAVGIPVLALVAVAPAIDARGTPLAFAGVWLVAAAWQVTPWKITALRRCHRTRVPRGMAAGPARVAAGAAYGGWCAASCGPAMAAMALTGHPMAMMALLTAGLTAERLAHRPHRVARRVAAAIALTTPVYLVAMSVA